MPQPDLFLELDAHHNAPIYLQERVSERSLHTGRDLTVLRGVAVTSDPAMHELFDQRLAQQGDGLWSSAAGSLPRQRWRVTRNSYSISGDRHQYQLTLRETEDLHVKALRLGDLELLPTRYREEFQGGILHAEASVLLDDASRDALRALMNVEESPYFPVVRVGINDQPIDMRFGMCGWSEHAEGTKYRLILVDRRYDEDRPNPRPHISECERQRRANTIAYRAALLDELLTTLASKGVLTSTEVESMRERAKGRVGEIRHAFLRVPDADELA